ncbi:phytanoyl-CoA dioxygenase family protein [Spongiactinospora sp. TRM90649]|uniref:phytanoyl-CoA dioxygenase family protein n=1 Tax=Spongiactinospora sp. TRM90649 TaxID=3031114 RepID=UPI0023F620C2|nr:phytanoyl-CoA dioxygenase family protein [Spongiactinospora sp. TRM90649]MDF5753482.1 phytanoyl-CoA dioxygenase family protein [Spongiactinospora sp. TRM90649]
MSGGGAGSHLLDDADVASVRDDGPRAHIAVKEGDIVVHDVRLVHGSGPNPSEKWRRTIVIEFADPEMPIPS